MTSRPFRPCIALLALLISFVGGRPLAAAPTTAPAADFSKTWLLHLPGIGGEMRIDHSLVRGLKDGGWGGPISIYDWTEHDPGLDALLAHKRNMREAAKVAKMIEDKLRQDPNLTITLTSHSAGTGIAVWALEMLPDNMKVQTLVLLASALSPRYDLSKALKHVRGKAYLFYSEEDGLVLGVGTTMFGTIDGKKTESAGLVGFTAPPGADKRQYAKLVQRPYEKGWMAFGNIGNHIGYMSRPFDRNVLAPILIEDLAQKDIAHPSTTQPAASTGSGQAASTGSGQAASTGSGQAASTGSARDELGRVGQAAGNAPAAAAAKETDGAE